MEDVAMSRLGAILEGHGQGTIAYAEDKADDRIVDGDLLALRANNAAQSWYGHRYHPMSAHFVAAYISEYLDLRNETNK